MVEKFKGVPKHMVRIMFKTIMQKIEIKCYIYIYSTTMNYHKSNKSIIITCIEKYGK
jgi:hypothetical protein